ncbi:hypothetical protein B0H13DRAFT_2319439 [Mycena leptocephala]|nr:hypothetical protein B0H13DRAFT_2319439 [Mycena leptocephala]
MPSSSAAPKRASAQRTHAQAAPSPLSTAPSPPQSTPTPAAPSANPRVLPTLTSQPQSTSASTSASTSESTATPAPPSSNPRVIPTPLSPSAPTHAPMSPTSPTVASKLPRFLQSPAQRDRSKSLSVDRPSSTASSASHATSNSTSTSSSRLSAGRFPGLGKDKDKERERQRIREAERGAPSAAELLTLQESSQDLREYDNMDSSYSSPPGSPPSAYGGTARTHTLRAPLFRVDAAVVVLPLKFLALPRRRHAAINADAKSSGIWRGRPPGSRTKRVVRAFGGEREYGRSLTHIDDLRQSKPRHEHRERALLIHLLQDGAEHLQGAQERGDGEARASTSKKGGDSGGSTGADGDAAPDRSAEAIWLMGVQLPRWGPGDEARGRRRRGTGRTRRILLPMGTTRLPRTLPQRTRTRRRGTHMPIPDTSNLTVGEFYIAHATNENAAIYLDLVPAVWKPLETAGK